MPTSRDLALLKAFEAVLAEGRFLDESLGTLLDLALRFFDAVAVALVAGTAAAVDAASLFTSASPGAGAADGSWDMFRPPLYRRSVTSGPRAPARAPSSSG